MGARKPKIKLDLAGCTPEECFFIGVMSFSSVYRFDMQEGISQSFLFQVEDAIGKQDQTKVYNASRAVLVQLAEVFGYRVVDTPEDKPGVKEEPKDPNPNLN